MMALHGQSVFSITIKYMPMYLTLPFRSCRVTGWMAQANPEKRNSDEGNVFINKYLTSSRVEGSVTGSTLLKGLPEA